MKRGPTPSSHLEFSCSHQKVVPNIRHIRDNWRLYASKKLSDSNQNSQQSSAQHNNPQILLDRRGFASLLYALAAIGPVKAEAQDVAQIDQPSPEAQVDDTVSKLLKAREESRPKFNSGKSTVEKAREQIQRKQQQDLGLTDIELEDRPINERLYDYNTEDLFVRLPRGLIRTQKPPKVTLYRQQTGQQRRIEEASIIARQDSVDSLLTVQIESYQSGQLKPTFTRPSDLSDLGTLNEIAKIESFVPAGIKLLSKSQKTIDMGSRPSIFGDEITLPLQNVYRYVYEQNMQKFWVAFACRNGVIVSVTCRAERDANTDATNILFNSVTESFRLKQKQQKLKKFK